CALWSWHGRRMGTWRVSGNGDPADCRPRIVLGNFTTRICVWLSARGACVLACISVLRMARSFRSRSVAGISCAFHPDEGAGIAGLVTAAGRDTWFLERFARCNKTPLGSLSLLHPVNEGVQPHVSWVPGHVSNFSRRTTALWRDAEGGNWDHLRFWRDLRWNTRGPSVAKIGPPPIDYLRCGVRDNSDPSLGFSAGFRASCNRRVCH